MMPANGRQQRADQEADELYAAHIISRQPRHFLIAADGIDLPPERPMAHHVGEGEEQDQCDHRRDRDGVEQPTVRQIDEVVEHDVVGDRPLAGVEVNAAAHDEHGAERDDKRIDADIGRKVAVHRADDEAEQQRRGDAERHGTRWRS